MIQESVLKPLSLLPNDSPQQMHIKHYHPEILKKNSSWAPNVADLAYARTVGDHLDLTASPTHSSSPVEKVLKGETLSKKSSRGGASGSPSDTKLKSTEKKAAATLGGASSLASTPKHPKEPKKKELLKQEPSLEGFPVMTVFHVEIRVSWLSSFYIVYFLFYIMI